MKIHIVQKGDTLWELSKKYNVDFEQLKAVNSQLTNPDMIMPGMKIKIPTGSVQVKKEAYIGDVAKKEAPKKEMPKEAPLPPPAPMPVEAPKMQMPQWQPIQFYQQPITVQQHQHVNEWDVNFNVYKPQPKPQPIPKMEMPKMPKPPAPPKVEKPKMKKPEIKPTAPAPKQVKPMPMQMPMAEQPKQVMAEQPKQMMMPQYQPCPPVAMPQMQYGVPCPPYYPVSPIMPGCGPSAPMQQTNCGSSGYSHSMGQMWDANVYGQQQQQLSPMIQPGMTPYMQGQQYPYQNHMQPPQPTQQFTQPQPYVPQQQHQQQPYAPYPQSPGWSYGYHQTQQSMPMYGQNQFPIPMHEEYDDLED